MKKTYIIPMLQLVKLNSETLIADSLGKFSSGADADVVLIKDDNAATSTPSGYNVGDDDWSE